MTQATVYMIYTPNSQDVYIGSTMDYDMRIKRHLNSFKHRDKAKFKCTAWLMFEKYGTENCFFKVLHTQDVSNRNEQFELEQKYMVQYSDRVNKINAFETKEIYEARVLQCRINFKEKHGLKKMAEYQRNYQKTYDQTKMKARKVAAYHLKKETLRLGGMFDSF